MSRLTPLLPLLLLLSVRGCSANGRGDPSSTYSVVPRPPFPFPFPFFFLPPPPSAATTASSWADASKAASAAALSFLLSPLRREEEEEWARIPPAVELAEGRVSSISGPPVAVAVEEEGVGEEGVPV